MEPVQLTVSAPQFFFIAGLLIGMAGGWFAGGWYKSRRKDGMTKDQVAEEGKALTEAKFMAGFKVIMNEIEKLKAK